MCKALADGGGRCASHTRKALRRAALRYDQACHADDAAYSALSKYAVDPNAGLAHETTHADAATTLTATGPAGPVGQVTSTVEKTPAGERVRLDWIEVDPDQRGRGIGTDLLRRAAAGRPVVLAAPLTLDGTRWAAAAAAETGTVLLDLDGRPLRPADRTPPDPTRQARHEQARQAWDAQQAWERTDAARLAAYRDLLRAHATHALTRSGARELDADLRAAGQLPGAWDRQEYLADVADLRDRLRGGSARDHRAGRAPAAAAR